MQEPYQLRTVLKQIECNMWQLLVATRIFLYFNASVYLSLGRIDLEL